MDQARHLSSPSPTSPFLFHHSERSYKSNPLTTLLSSTGDVANVDDCFTEIASPTQNELQNQNQEPFASHQHQHSLADSLDDDHHHHHHQRHDNVDQCVIEQDSLTGVDDDEGMRNMLSGSSASSSTSTIPLLNENHSHHSFSRISLEEYSPLSLVEDCDNALSISPTSLACGAHSFKSSLNGLKMDNLVDVGVHDHVDDPVNDARSMSPSLLSVSAGNNHHNLWSNSSTAITQNPTLLNSTSTSFLLSQHQHHQHQLNSLIQQLEPQSLDEPPPLITNSSSLELISSDSHRPSSEPPPGSGSTLADIEPKSVINQPDKSKQQSSSKSISGGSTTASSSSSSGKPSRRNRNRSNNSVIKQQQATSACSSVNKSKKAESKAGPSIEPVLCSKLHLQLNHQEKLKELQQRLFGNCNQTDTSAVAQSGDSSSKNSSGEYRDENNVEANHKTTSKVNNEDLVGSKEEPDSSGFNKKNAATTTAKAKTNTKTKSNAAPAAEQSKPRTRPSRNRKSRAKNDGCNSSSSASPTTAAEVVTTESAEPDTTTKSSDCIKLADLLSASASSKANNIGIVLNNSPNTGSNESLTDIGEKRIQQIQLQVSPSLTVVSNGGLMQTMNIQQQLQGATVVSTSALSNQLLCRSQAVVASAGSQQKCNVVSSNEAPKGSEAAVMPNWSLQAVNTNCSNNGNTISSFANNQTIGAHQIAIQVICQDGTSLVLPVSSAAGLNTAMSLSSQQQHLQAVLTNNTANNATNTNGNLSQQRNANQILPLVSVSNIVAQQQQIATIASEGSSNGSSNSSNYSQRTSTSPQISGLAASSPTLAALLDAGPSRATNLINSDISITKIPGQELLSGNFLRKLVGGNSATAEIKRGELSLQPGTQIGLTSNGSLVTVCTANSNRPSPGSTAKNVNVNLNLTNSGSSEKRIKLENAEIGGLQTTFTLIDPQNLIVANGNDKSPSGRQSVASAAKSSASASNNGETLNQTANKNSTDTTSKQSRMASSTGNRQVDPTQPFRCEHCNSTFTRLGNFTRHKKIHTVPTKVNRIFIKLSPKKHPF